MRKIDPELEIRWGYPESLDWSKCDCWIIGRKIEFEGREKGFRNFTDTQMDLLYHYHEWVPMMTLRGITTECGCPLPHKLSRCGHGKFGAPYDPGQKVFDATRLGYHYRENGGTIHSARQRYEAEGSARAARDKERKKAIRELVRDRRRSLLNGPQNLIGATSAYGAGHSRIWRPGDPT